MLDTQIMYPFFQIYMWLPIYIDLCALLLFVSLIRLESTKDEYLILFYFK